ncbi:MAG: dicarboxylate/amino acid:cation symporter [Vicinamibacterales bacterium]|nr:dicarboxylate/amino acid:cation symporter [Vicinamibacterales bacterium]
MESFERELVSDLDDKTDDSTRSRRRLPLHVRILLGLALGAGSGGLARAVLGPESARLSWIVANIAEPAGQLFLRSLLMTVVPLVASSLIVGVAGIGDVRRLGRVGLKTLAYTLVISLISVVIGLTLANTVKPGTHVNPETRDLLLKDYGTAAAGIASSTAPGPGQSPVLSFVTMLVPANPIESMARSTPDMIGLMFFSIVFGAALTLLTPDRSGPVIALLNGIFEAVAKVIDIVMKVAPIGVACLIFTMTARFGFGFLGSLAWYVLTVLAGLGIHMFVVYPLALKLFARVSPVEFFKQVRTVMLTAFSTSSSNATLPTALRVSELNLGVPRDIGSFVLTVGATANQNGTALYEGVTVLFLAQLAGVDLTLSQQLLVLYLAILGSIGTAGVPAGSIPFVVAVLVTVGINPALIAVIIGVDRLLDMCRTTLNVIGDMTAAVYVARSEGATLKLTR